MVTLLTSSEVELMETNQCYGVTLVNFFLLTSSEVELMETMKIPQPQNYPALLTSSEVELMETWPSLIFHISLSEGF